MLSATQKRWLEAPHFFRAGESSTFVTKISADRGLRSEGTFPSPYLLTDMKRAKERIEHAVKEKETICIFGDYDCDGITAAAQLVRYFRRRGVEPLVRLPHRLKDGYGLKNHIVDEFKAQGVHLLITVDTGISSEKEIAYAAAQGIETIISDHHHIPQELPSAYAILHPGLSKAYPEPYPSGSGVAYQLVRALEDGKWEGQDIDTALAMIGTVGDLVPLSGANRMLVQKGLNDFMNLKQCPLADLRDAARPTKEYSSRDIAFVIAPRINAAGRMDDPTIALHALLDGGTPLDTINDLNVNRQTQTLALYEQAVAVMKTQEDTPFFCLEHADFPPGIIGLIAGRMVQDFGKPALIASRMNDMCTASLRGVPGYHLMEGLNACKDLLTSFGGHAMAAGCTFPLKHFPEIQKHLSAHILSSVPIENLVPTLVVDGELSEKEITLAFVESLKLLEPYGQGNPEPLFMMNDVLLSNLKLVGTDGRHLQARLGNIKMIGFGLGGLLESLEEPIDIACKVSINEWQGRTEPQIVIEDIRVRQKEPAAVNL